MFKCIDLEKLFNNEDKLAIIHDLSFVINKHNLDNDLNTPDDEVALYLFNNLVSLYKLLNHDNRRETTIKTTTKTTP